METETEMETEVEKGRQNYKLQSEVFRRLPGKNCDCYLSLGL